MFFKYCDFRQDFIPIPPTCNKANLLKLHNFAVTRASKICRTLQCVKRHPRPLTGSHQSAVKGKCPLHLIDEHTEVGREALTCPRSLASRGYSQTPATNRSAPLSPLPNWRHPETWPVEGSPLPSVAAGATWGRRLRLGLGVQLPPGGISRVLDTEYVRPGVPRPPSGAPSVHLLFRALESNLTCSLRPRWSFGTFCRCASLTSQRRKEAGRRGTGICSVGTRPARLNPARLRRPVAPGPRAYRLPSGRNWRTLQGTLWGQQWGLLHDPAELRATPPSVPAARAPRFCPRPPVLHALLWGSSPAGLAPHSASRPQQGRSAPSP